MPKVPSKAAIYLRISEDRDGDELGVGRQLEDCQALAERRGWPVAEVYTDDDRSAWSGKPRPNYLRMLADIDSGEIDAVIAYDHYRLHRRPAELEHFFGVCDRAGLKHMATYSGDIDLSTEDGRFHARILGAVASKESADKSRRIKRKHAELAQKGAPHGGATRGFGYAEDRVTVIPSEAAIVREFAARLLAGDSLRSMCADLDARGIPTVKGNRWSPESLRGVLRSGRVSGQREYHGEIIGPAVWPAIIPPEQTARIRAMLADPARRVSRTARRYVLSGMLRCGSCGAKLVARPRTDRHRRYVCVSGPGHLGCGRLTIVAEPLEEFITEAALYRLDTPELHAALNGRNIQSPDAAAIQADIDDAAAQLDELAAAYASKSISMREWLSARLSIEQRGETARKRLSRLNGSAAIAGFVGNAADLRTRWGELSLARQQAILKALLSHVVVRPSGPRARFDSDRLEAVWRL